ncbi:sigma-70 family RNA polymerase sigma factor [Dyadobacter sp. LHD-138]|uniref:RNA polymerase sigma factor n=1 Tax=Dyadobacter sp. LHD-138 TaxID=3071413 RepID=UPI0027E0583C|nr:sigma-70 family RNA polymerase sigma factor [Dyadobacter sp. LHD-138]MDQ6477056.1 sigma-70 family RNA polymerase sigma factor [Dyadobacter sp. LHD-138]
MTNGPLDEQQLWSAFQSGNEDAYTSLYRLHVKAMYRYGMSLVSVSEAFVFDCIHDVFTEIWVKRERLSIPENVRYYLLKSLKVRIIHLLQRQEKPHSSLTREEFDDLWSEPSIDELYVQKEEAENRQEMMRKLIALLPHRQQEAIRLRFTENMDYQEIGNILDVNRQSAQNLVYRAVQKLREWLI